MPVITVEASKFTIEQKRELVKVLTKAASGIMNIPEQAYTVLIKDNPRDNIAVGGVLLSDRDKALAEKKS
jgi:4-oxalocrotonate tautomerase